MMKDEDHRMMDDTTFKELFEADELGLILADGGTNITKKQLAMVKKRAKELSEDKILKEKMAMATKPGYAESILVPLQRQILENAAGAKGGKTTSKQEETHTEKVVKKAVEKAASELKQSVPKPALQQAQADVDMSYQRGKKIRSTRLSSMILDRMASGQSIGGSIKSSVSDKMKAKALGLKEKFDPLNMVKFMTGGSALATGIAGKVFGRSQEDIDYFTGRKKTRKGKATRVASGASLTPAENISNSTEALSSIYNLLKNTRDEKREELQKMKSFEEERMHAEEKQYNEIINVFNDAMGKNKRKKKEKDFSSSKLNFDSIFKKKAFKGGKMKGLSQESLEKSLFSKLGIVALGGVAVLGVGAAVASQIPSKRAENRDDSKPTATGGKSDDDTATRIPTERVSNIQYENILKKLREREGDYNHMNRVAGELSESYNVVPGNPDIASGGQIKYTKPLTEMTIDEVQNLQISRANFYNSNTKKYNASQGAGQAAGAYGFMMGTLNDTAWKLFGKNMKNEKFSKENQDKLATQLVNDVIAKIKSARLPGGEKLPVSEAMIATMWVFGTSNPLLAYKLVYGTPGDTLIENMVSSSTMLANPQFRDKDGKSRNIQWFRDTYLGGGSKKTGALSTIPLQGTVTGDILEENNRDNVGSKNSLKGEKQSMFFNKTINPTIENHYITQVATAREPHPILG